MTRASQKIAFKDKIAYIILKQRICCLHKKRIMAEINKTEDQKLEQKLARQMHLRENHKRNTADLVVECLVNEGVEVVFGIPGEENIPLLEAIERDGRIRFVLTRHEQGAGFMAATYAHITGKPGVCLATLGPGALNLTLPVAQANASTTPLVAICAQGTWLPDGCDRQ